jgi:gas vesicle protein
MTTIAVQRTADKSAWEFALEKANIDREAVVSSVQLEADKLSTIATTAIDSLGKELQHVRASLSDSEHHVEVVQKELRALKRDARNPANLAVRNSGLESELFELRILHSSL